QDVGLNNIYFIAEDHSGNIDSVLVKIVVQPGFCTKPNLVNGQIFNVDENAPNGYLIDTILAYDSDSIYGDILSYQILDGNNGGFMVIASDGRLIVNNTDSIDFETNTQFSLDIEITDLLNNKDTTTITINVIYVNEPVYAGFGR